ncbi:phosphoribosyltransferase [Candidatus Woesebacteria bacterium]|nr:phosphoribosyltransferase [Candidatus Woesebacteria bacterium]
MELNNTIFSNDPIQYLAPSWDDMDHLVFSISRKIIEDGLQFDRIVTMAKGGWPMARPLVDYIQANEVASIGIKLYKGIESRQAEPEVYQDIPVDIVGETILLFDDVADTGETLEFVKKYLEGRGVKKIYTATLFYKPHSSITPDYFGAETIAWIIFPYELRETMDVLVDKWESEGLNEATIVDRFETLGFKRKMIEYFYSTLYK